MQHAHVRRHGHFNELAIDPVTDAQIALQGFDMDVGGAFLEAFTEDLIHKVEHRGFLISLIEHIDFLLQVIVLIGTLAAFEQLFKILRTDAVSLMQCFQNAVTAGDLPADAFAQLLTHGLTRAEIKGVVGQHRGFDRADVRRIDAVTQRQFGGEAIVQALLSFAFIPGEGHVQHRGELGEKTFLVHHACVEQGLDHRLPFVTGILQDMAQFRFVTAAGLFRGLGKDIGERLVRHVGGAL